MRTSCTPNNSRWSNSCVLARRLLTVMWLLLLLRLAVLEALLVLEEVQLVLVLLELLAVAMWHQLRPPYSGRCIRWKRCWVLSVVLDPERPSNSRRR